VVEFMKVFPDTFGLKPVSRERTGFFAFGSGCAGGAVNAADSVKTAGRPFQVHARFSEPFGDSFSDSFSD